MKRASRLAVLAAGSLLSFTLCRAYADALLLKDGRFITGDVTHTDRGYLVKTHDGVETFSDDQVEHWAHSRPAGGTDPVATSVATAGTPATPLMPASKASKTLSVLVSRGNDALAAGDYNAARGAFADSLTLASHDPVAAQGLGFCMLQLKNYAKARDVLEIAYAGVHPLPRSLAANLAVALTKTHNPMRSAKVLREYLVAHPELLDEPALNALAGAMFSADEMTQHNGFYQQMAQFYQTYNARLEATRPGEKRWGTTWLPAAEADRKLLVYNQKKAKVADLNRRMAQAMANGKAAEDAAAEAVNDARFDANAKRALQGKINGYQQVMDNARVSYQTDAAALAKVREGFEEPPIDDSLSVVLPESATAPSLVAAGASTATPVGTGQAGTGAAPMSSGTPQSPVVSVSGQPPARGTPAAPAVIAAAPIEPPAPNRKLHISVQAVAFPVAPDLLVTAADAVSNATSITVTMPNGDDTEAEFVTDDKESGLALIRLKKKKMSYLSLGASYAGGSIQCFSFPEVSLFDPSAVAMPGNVVAAGQKQTLTLTRSPRLAGGPLVWGNTVVGVELATRDTDPKAIPVATLDDIKRLVADKAGGSSSPTGGADPKGLIVQLTAVRDK